ncbi:hypothetical protein [Levilactobacillus sp. HBUAS70063]|uniref:hypothetical protein n=1 Tax=Levilactobacillus sp. HBUAS70063 TaxID=3109359 RepID=UPI003132D84B
MMKNVLRYLAVLLYGVLALVILLTWNIQNTKNSWLVPITPYTVWLLLSWLLGYPWLRGRLGYLFLKDNRKATSTGITVRPWQYAIGSTRSIGEIFSLIYIFCEHLLISLLLILFGPLLVCTLLLIALFKKRRS